jgi:hypothetical protein
MPRLWLTPPFTPRPTHPHHLQLPFLEPEYLALPDIPDAPAEEPLPIFFPPEVLQVREVTQMEV